MQADSQALPTRPRILIAATDESGDAMATSLREIGHEVSLVATPARLLRLAIEFNPDLCIIDQAFQADAALELAVQMQAETQVPYLFLATPAPGMARKAAEHGAAGFLTKPFASAQLVAAVESALVSSAKLAGLRDAANRLRSALHAGRDTSVATGVFMERYHMSQDQAFDALRSYARTHSRRIAEVANEVIRAQELLNTAKPRGATRK